MAKKKGEDYAKKLRRDMDKIESAEQWRDNGYKEKWKRFYKRYRNYVDALEDKTRSNISVPFTFVQVETILPRLVETLFAARPYVTVKPRSPLWEMNAEKMQTLLDYQQNEVFDIQDEFHIGLKIMAIYGTTVGYVGWKLQERDIIRKELQPVMIEDAPLMDEMGEPVMDYLPAKVTETEYDDPILQFMDLGHFYVDPNAEDIDDARYCGHREYKTKEQLEEMERQGIIEVDWKKVEKENKQNEPRNERMSSVGIPSVEDNQLYNYDNLYEVHHLWEDDRWAIIINRSCYGRDGENPFWHKRKPYVKEVYTKVPGEFYGIGVVEIIEDQQDELNTERNMRIDYRAHNLRRMFWKKRGADVQGLTWRQNGWIVSDDRDDFDILEAPNIGGDTFNQEQIVKDDMKQATGAHDVVMGTSSSGETATTTMSKDNNASMRFKLIISSVEKRLLVGVSRLMIQLNQQFIDDVRQLPLFDEKGEEWPEIAPEDIQGEFHLIAAGSSVEPLANKEAFKQRMVELYTLASADPFFQQFPDKRRNLLKKVFEAFDIQNTDDILPTDEELSGVMQQQVISQFIATLPPELQQLMAAGQAPMMTSGPPSVGGGANTAMMQEAGMGGG